VLECYADSASYAEYNINLDGATTSTDYFRVIRAASGHRGTTTDCVRFIKTLAISYYMLLITENYSSFYDIACSTITTGSSNYVEALATIGTGNRVIGCTVYNCRATGTSFHIGIYIGNPGITNYIADCYVTNCTGGTHNLSAGILVNSQVSGIATGYIYNCTVTSCHAGIKARATSGETAIAHVKNCIVQGNTTNISTPGQGGTETINQTTNVTSGVTFDADGYHLDSEDTGAINQGTDLSSDTNFAFDDDIDSETHSGTWDIGADEIPPSRPPLNICNIFSFQGGTVNIRRNN